jgi:YNFM family putative membrane transporter
VDAPEQIRHGTPAFRRTNLALFVAGFATFALLYCVQPLMPVFAQDFHLTAAQSSLSLSLTTGLLAPAMIVIGAFSEARGRTSIMVGSLLGSSVLTLLSALAPQWNLFLAARALAGITFAGFPAVSMAYLSEEVHPGSIGLAMGLSIGGNGLGGMVGRLFTSSMAGVVSWRWAVGIVGVGGLAATLLFWRMLPPSRYFIARPLRAGSLIRGFGAQLRNPKLLALYAIGFLIMGAFVSTYNYATYHLLAPPYSISQTAVGLIFLVYPFGVFSSAWIGARADRAGRRKMLMLMFALMFAGIALTVLRPLIFVLVGITAVTFGFFGGHSVASSWIGMRASHGKAQAAALYLFCYYMGASVGGSVGGVFWDAAHWPGVAGYVAALLGAGFLVAGLGTG